MNKGKHTAICPSIIRSSMHANITVGFRTRMETFTTEESQVSRGCYGKQIIHGVQMYRVPNKVDLFESKLVLTGVLQQVAADWCSIRDTSRQHLGWTLPDTVNTVKCSWWWAKTSPETCRADLAPWISFIQNTSRQQNGWTLSYTLNTVKCSWWLSKIQNGPYYLCSLPPGVASIWHP
jgi:hypothetical protein